MTTYDNEHNLFFQTSLAFSWAVRAAATLRLADLIASGVTHLEELAAQANVDADALRRLLRYLISRGVFAEPAPGNYILTGTALLLQDTHPQRLRAWLDQEGVGGKIDLAWSGLLESIHTGKPAYPNQHGRSFWEDLAANPTLRTSFNSLLAGHVQASEAGDALVAGYDWRGIRHVVDVGGGSGKLLAAILQANPTIYGTLIDVPDTVRSTRETFVSTGLSDRCEVIAGSFFEPLPSGGDIYLLSFILHDWDDHEARAILRRCAQAAGRSGRVLIREGVSGGDSDLLMLVVLGGRERTPEEFSELVKSSGMTLRSTERLASGHLLMECVAQ
jgi:hypothetical protein